MNFIEYTFKNILDLHNNSFLIGIAHFLFALFIALYGILTKKNSFDTYYIYGMILLVISWTFYDGECPITYYLKKSKNKEYVAGEDSNDLDEIFSSFNSNKNIVKKIIFISNFLEVYSLYIVSRRNHYPWYILNIVPLFTLIYLMLCRYIKQSYKSNIFLSFQFIVKIYFVLVLLTLII
jgi:hypothetical protein